MTAKRVSAYASMLTVAIIWGLATIVIKFTIKGIDPLPFLTYRFALSAMFALPFLIKANKNIRWDIKTLGLVVIYSLSSTTIALGLLFLGIDQTTVLNLSLITISAPLIMGVGGVIFFHEHITKREKIGSAIALAGSILTAVEPIIENGANIGTLYGNLLIFGYLSADIASILILKKLLRSKLSISPMNLTNLAFVIGFVSILPIAAMNHTLSNFKNILTTLPFEYHLGVWYMALVSGTIAYAMRARAQKTIEVGEAALFGYLSPIFSVPLAVLFLQETLTPLFVVGAAIIGTGVFIAETKPR